MTYLVQVTNKRTGNVTYVTGATNGYNANQAPAPIEYATREQAERVAASKQYDNPCGPWTWTAVAKPE